MNQQSLKHTIGIGDRMKQYENVTRTHLIRRMPVIIRLDSKAGHTWTRGLDKPFDRRMTTAMIETTKFLLQEIQGAEIGYTQSDEISIFLRDYSRIESEAWFDNNIQKIVSISASLATGFFNKFNKIKDDLLFFDSRVFNLPKEEVINYMIWRQQDAQRNSIQGLGQAHLSHKQMQGLNSKQVQEELLKLNIDWNDLPDLFKHGQAFFRNNSEMPTPIFKENRDFLNELIYIKEKTNE